MPRMIRAFLLCLTLTACAAPEPRYLTAAEDAEMRAVCEPAGCVSVPAPVWGMIEELLGGERI